MATIQTPCPDCGEKTQLDPSAVALLPGDSRAHAHYAFVCTECERPVVKPADEHAVGLLRVARISVAGPTETCRTGHPEAPQAGEPFTPDDLIEFHCYLAADGWFDRLVSRGR
jgi:hypothetical protein